MQAEVDSLRFLAGDGELARLIRNYDWASTELGPITGWPQSLRTVVAMVINSPVPIVLLWGVKGYMLYNDAYSKFAGGRHPALLGSEVRKGWPEVAEFNDQVMKVGLSGGTLAYRDQELTLYRHGVPERVWMNLDYSPVCDESGTPAGVIAIVVETTERVLADRRNAEEKQRLGQMFEQGPSFMALLSGPLHRIELANASYIKLVGGRDVVGKTVAEALPEAAAQGYVRMLDDVFASGRSFSSPESKYEVKATAERAADTRYVDFIYQPLRDAAQHVTGIFVEGIDVTERKYAEAALKKLNETLEQRIDERTALLMAKDALITTFFQHSPESHAVLGEMPDGRFRFEEANPALLDLYGKSHDAIVGHTVEELLTPEAATELNAHLRACLDRDAPYRYERNVNGAIVEALAMPVPTQSGLPKRLVVSARDVNPKPTDINTLVRGMIELIQRTIGPAISFEFVAAMDLWKTVADPHQLENALLNLCLNARDAMPDGGRLTVETSNRWLDERSAVGRELKPGQYVSLSVSDNGTGMSAEVISRAFDPFFTTKPLGEGTGLGLSMVYGFARQSGGQTRIYSEVGRGTTVSVYLPRHVDDIETVAESSEHREEIPTPQGETVLVVDDEQTVRMLVTDVLEELGYAAIGVGDGKSGLEILESKRHIDLLITDVGLPGGMNGRQLADAGLVLRPDLKVLFITGYAENAVIGDGHLKRGMHVLTKPFAIDSLASRIAIILKSAP